VFPVVVAVVAVIVSVCSVGIIGIVVVNGSVVVGWCDVIVVCVVGFYVVDVVMGCVDCCVVDIIDCVDHVVVDGNVVVGIVVGVIGDVGCMLHVGVVDVVDGDGDGVVGVAMMVLVVLLLSLVIVFVCSSAVMCVIVVCCSWLSRWCGCCDCRWYDMWYCVVGVVDHGDGVVIDGGHVGVYDSIGSLLLYVLLSVTVVHVFVMTLVFMLSFVVAL